MDIRGLVLLLLDGRVLIVSSASSFLKLNNPSLTVITGNMEPVPGIGFEQAAWRGLGSQRRR